MQSLISNFAAELLGRIFGAYSAWSMVGQALKDYSNLLKAVSLLRASGRPDGALTMAALASLQRPLTLMLIGFAMYQTIMLIEYIIEPYEPSCEPKA